LNVRSHCLRDYSITNDACFEIISEVNSHDGDAFDNLCIGIVLVLRSDTGNVQVNVQIFFLAFGEFFNRCLKDLLSLLLLSLSTHNSMKVKRCVTSQDVAYL